MSQILLWVFCETILSVKIELLSEILCKWSSILSFWGKKIIDCPKDAAGIKPGGWNVCEREVEASIGRGKHCSAWFVGEKVVSRPLPIEGSGDPE